MKAKSERKCENVKAVAVGRDGRLAACAAGWLVVLPHSHQMSSGLLAQPPVTVIRGGGSLAAATDGGSLAADAVRAIGEAECAHGVGDQDRARWVRARRARDKQA